MPSANIRPADGPPMRSSSAIFTLNGAVLASVTPTPSTARVAPDSSVPRAVVICAVPARPARSYATVTVVPGSVAVSTLPSSATSPTGVPCTAVMTSFSDSFR